MENLKVVRSEIIDRENISKDLKSMIIQKVIDCRFLEFKGSTWEHIATKSYLADTIPDDEVIIKRFKEHREWLAENDNLTLMQY